MAQGPLRFVVAFPLYVQQWTAAFAVFVFVTLVVSHMARVRRVSVRDLPLDGLLSRVFAGSSIPTGVLLVICAFDDAVLAQANEIGLYVAAAGLTLIYLSLKEIFDREEAPAVVRTPFVPDPPGAGIAPHG
ncbi:MAG TPA: hypothetical protein VHG91_19085 [Longimicrobium sp.]|nr:hypothetical protein [Longimicrobium sp.]